MSKEDTRSCDQHPKLAKFKGEGDQIKINVWLKIFETIYPKETTSKLVYYLEGKALEYYGEHILGSNISSWETVKSKLTTRFGPKIYSTLLVGMQRRLKLDENVQSYFDGKIDLLMSTSLSQAEIIVSLTDGLPIKWRHDFNGREIRNYEQWLQIALTAEALDKKDNTKMHKSYQTRSGSTHTATPATSHSRTVDKKYFNNKNKLPSPCKHCKEKYNKDYFHWHKDCPTKDQNLQIEQTDFGNDGDDQITLN